MSFQVRIGYLGGTVFFSVGILYPSANYGLRVWDGVDGLPL